MVTTDTDYVNQFELVIAYRKAKADLYYSSEKRLADLVTYERDLEGNLLKLEQNINSGDDSWVKDRRFLGSITYIPKDIEPEGQPDTNKDEPNLISFTPKKNWRDSLKEEGLPRAVFRLMARCSIDFHVLSSLWIARVGSIFDAKLDDSVYASRVRRTKDKKYNKYALGNFHRYLHPYREWRDKGIDAIGSLLDDNTPALAVTADATGFFHRLDPAFLLNEQFLQRVCESPLGPLDARIHRLFVSALQAWSNQIASDLGMTDSNLPGLPVGLPASALVANLALAELDDDIHKQLKPRFYGRYVDDIVIVLEADEDLTSASKVWEWITYRVPSLRYVEDPGSSKHNIALDIDYLGNSQVEFSNRKNRVYLLEGASGQQVLRSLRRTIGERSSEWRMMPELPADARQVPLLIAEATSPDGDLADSLSKMEKLSATRGGFSLVLRDIEAYQRDVDVATWAEHRAAFFSAVREYILVLPTFFRLATYLPRIIKVALNCGDVEAAIQLINDIDALIIQVRSDCRISIASTGENVLEQNQVVDQWASSLQSELASLVDSIAPDRLDEQGKERVRQALKVPYLPDEAPREKFLELFRFDLADIPFRDSLAPKSLAMSTWYYGLNSPGRIHELVPTSIDLDSVPEKLDHLVAVVGHQSFLGQLEVDHPNRISGLVFPTRPLQVIEILSWTSAVGQRGAEHANLPGWFLVTRGLESEHDFAPGSSDLRDVVIELPTAHIPSSRDKVRVAVGSVKTSDKSLERAIHGNPDLSFERYQRLASFINQVASTKEDHPDYLLLPELSVPVRWFHSIARRLKSENINLIAGVEYLLGPRNQIHNQLWASLIHTGLGFPSIAVYRQDKLRPAPGERTNLDHQNGSVLVPAVEWNSPPVIHHGNFAFAMLICSELTNIAHRAALRGRVDALFVAEWNRDLTTFQALVESAALDIHAFVVQANNRTYGDSRIRGPYKLDYRRDVVRVRGGLHDHFVVGELEIRELRSFQSRLQSDTGIFKPTPDNFDADFESDGRRRQIP